MSPGDTDYRLKAVESKCSDIENMKINMGILVSQSDEMKDELLRVRDKLDGLAVRVAAISAGAGIATQILISQFQR